MIFNPYYNKPGEYEVYKADNGGVRFQVRYPRDVGFANFALTARGQPKKDLYVIAFGPVFRFTDTTKDNKHVQFRMPVFLNSNFQEFTLTWYNNLIQLNFIGENKVEPIVEYRDEQITSNNVGFVKFYTKSTIHVTQWLVEPSPIILPPSDKIFKDGRLHWVPMTDRDLPENAFIGGFEDEVIYVARSFHRGSLCPGKYVPSKHQAYIPWGHREHAKDQFDILCGYNAKWVKSRSNQIPENAFIGGYSEVRREPLYIGRAMLEGNLITGKVHVLYYTCYLPYKGKEVEIYNDYEILVEMDSAPRTVNILQWENKRPRMLALDDL